MPNDGRKVIDRTRRALFALVALLLGWVVAQRASIWLGALVAAQYAVFEVVTWYRANAMARSLQARVAEQEATAERLRWMATHDTLTGLPNRVVLGDHLEAVLTDHRPGDVAVLFIDLDNFKMVNDSLGHAQGDELLRATAERLRDALPERDLLCRFGGDEFVAVIVRSTPGWSPGSIADRLLAAMSQSFQVGGSDIFVSASVGVTVADVPDLSALDVLRDADSAMYRAKAHGRNRVETTEPGVHEASGDRLQTFAELRRGLEQGEVFPYFQPIRATDGGQLVGFEALARWRHPRRGLLQPSTFVDLAEDGGLLLELGAKVLDQAVAAFAGWRRAGAPADLYLAVNVGVHQLLDEGFPTDVELILRRHRIDPSSLWLEITETALMTDLGLATTNLLALREIGVHITVDDFGTGYASLTYLQRFPVEAVKIDRSFVQGLGLHDSDTTIVGAVVDLCHALGLRVIAEGVETPAQLEHLNRLGCDSVQGFLLDQALPPEVAAQRIPAPVLSRGSSAPAGA